MRRVNCTATRDECQESENRRRIARGENVGEKKGVGQDGEEEQGKKKRKKIYKTTPVCDKTRRGIAKASGAGGRSLRGFQASEETKLRAYGMGLNHRRRHEANQRLQHSASTTQE